MVKKLFSGYLKQSTLKINRYIKDKVAEDSPNNIVSNLIVKSEDNYSIIREENSRAYIMSLPNLIIVGMCKKKKSCIEDFEMLYGNSKEYLFDVYETERYYHIICLSKYSQHLTLERWLYANEADPKYMNLFDMYGPFLIMNKSWFVSLSQTQYQTKYTFVKTIGSGIKINEISKLVEHAIKLINNQYMKFLPTHYLSYP
jgi:hypothetical protein